MKIKLSAINNRFAQRLVAIATGMALTMAPCTSAHATVSKVNFEPIQTALFTNSGGQAVAWADVDNDGDLDLTVGFRRGTVHLYQQHQGEFKHTPIKLSKPLVKSDYRSLSWGDFNRDGFADLYIGFGRDSGHRNRLLVGSQYGFTEQAQQVGVDALGTSRQSTWLDYDNDGDTDLFVAMRDRTSKLFQNNGNSFVDVSKATGLNDPRRSVGAVWFDFDRDGDLDLYLPNQSGDRDGFYRNNQGKFEDIAKALGVSRPERPLREGSVGATLCDVNNDGHFDIFVPVYGKDMLYIANGKGGFSEQAATWGVNNDAQAVSADCGDFDNDGLMDLYLAAYQAGKAHGSDRLYHNRGGSFVDVFPASLHKFDGDHGVRFADYDNDGDLDLALTNRHQNARLSVWRNNLSQTSQHNYLKVLLLDNQGLYTRQGDEVRIYQAGTDKLIGTSIVDTGGGYVSQNMQALHFGLGKHSRVDIEVTSMSQSGRQVKRINNQTVNQQITIKADHIK
ncbi:CRTAC1 family protein [Thalassotalea euphylliae]|uniref:CRTAC1 family protein n=1 Tax=Thalassotalea euphylliae TaxID=1655234 RepID=A0A3E0TUQ7_9GAMM|nr:CRTAC1 family protein [Thalassotalea euphylliae]REL28113.1 CRTAC1 family protein [Thalassotalea euphylliae]